MTAGTARIVHEEIDTAIKAILAKYGMTQKAGSKVVYSDTGFTYKIEGVELKADGSRKLGKQEIYDAEYIFMKNGYKVEDSEIQKMFEGTWTHSKIGTIHLEMIDTKKHKYPFIVKNTLGASYKLSADQFIRIAGIKASNY